MCIYLIGSTNWNVKLVYTEIWSDTINIQNKSFFDNVLW